MSVGPYYNTPEYLLREIVVPVSLLQLTGSLTLDSQKRLTLVGDSISPGNNMVYGTDGSGIKGWYVQSGGSTFTLTNGNGTTVGTDLTSVGIGGTLTSTTAVNVNNKSLFIGDGGNSGLHFNDAYIIAGGAKYGLWSNSSALGSGVAIGFGDLTQTGDFAYAGIFTGAANKEVTMSAGSSDGQVTEFWMQANDGINYDIILSDLRVVPKGIEYESDYSATLSTRSLTHKTYVDSRLSGKSLPAAPTITQNGQGLRWNNSTAAWEYYTPATIIITPSALTKTDDTNVTLTLGGTPSTALLQATSLTLGWTGLLSGTRGGSGVSNAGTLTWGANNVTFITSGVTSLTLPTSGTIAATSSVYTLGAGGTATAANTFTGSATNTFAYVFSALGTTLTPGAGAFYQNNTAAALGAQQISPSIVQRGRGWATTGSTSQTVDFAQYVLPIQGAASPTGTWGLYASINNGAYGEVLTVNATGVLTVTTGNLIFTPSTNTLSIGGNSGTATLTFGTAGTASIISNHTSGENRLSSITANFWTVYSNNAEALRVNTTGNLLIGSTSDNARLYVVQQASSSAWLPVYRSDPGAHTSLTASTEFISRDFQGATQTWLAGTVARQRFNYFKGYTVAGASATANFTEAYTMWIDPPVQGTNAAITSNISLGVNGISLFTNLSNTILINPASSTISYSTAGNINSTMFELFGLTNDVYLRAKVAGGSVFIGNTNNGNYLGVGARGTITISPGATTASPVASLALTAPAHTILTASTENIDINFNLARSVQFNTGALTTQRAFIIQAPTYTFIGASVISDAYTTFITGSPIQGTNATITRSWALGVAGSVQTSGSTAFKQTTPTTLASSTNDYAIGIGTYFRLAASAPVNVTGIAGGVDGRQMIINNVGANNIVFTNEDVLSVAANRITTSTAGNLTIAPKGSITLMYDITNSRWIDIAVR